MDSIKILFEIIVTLVIPAKIDVEIVPPTAVTTNKTEHGNKSMIFMSPTNIISSSVREFKLFKVPLQTIKQATNNFRSPLTTSSGHHLGACIALHAKKWSKCMEELCGFHDISLPKDEKFTVGTGSNPVAPTLVPLKFYFHEEIKKAAVSGIILLVGASSFNNISWGQSQWRNESYVK
ncbi:hypothetical protein L2E82_43047 [Cichorium intybus]|uniref:Uncharacterized protein n=1 Tax=Cichorium intybus TaxID=13427 RepID=A0ACB8ZN13_CICIN|nr:hypothetical protein L2E82_43047 [Cichorium intybus]